MISIVVNGEPASVEAGTTVAVLLEARGVRDERVAVEVNLDVIRRDKRKDRVLVEGDRVEIVSFVGGG